MKKELYTTQVVDNFEGIDWIAFPLVLPKFMNVLNSCIKNGFGNPVIVDTTPSGKKIVHSLSLTKKKECREDVHLETLYVLQQYKRDDAVCSLYAKFNSHALSFLKKLCVKKEGEEGKEIGGKLNVTRIERNRSSYDEYVFIIGLNEDHIEQGGSENVDLPSSRYNFHSHPEDAYIKYGVTKAWPSVHDYLAYLKLGNKTIFHCVSTLEGIYIISFGRYWVNNLNKVDRNFVRDNYKIDQKNKMDIYEYVTFINKLKYKNSPIFQLKFLPWNLANSIFTVVYAKTGLSCKAF